MKVEERRADPLLPGRQKAAVGKPRVKPGAAVTRPSVRPTPPKKPVVTPKRPQQQSQRRMAPANAQTSFKPPVAARRDALERQKMPRGGTNLDTQAKKRQISVPPPRPKVGGGSFPVDVEEQDTIKKFMADSESAVSFGIAATIREQPHPSSVGRAVDELVNDVAAAIDVDELNRFTTDETSDQPPRSWRELPLDTDEPQHLKTDNRVDDFSLLPPSTRKPSSVRLQDTVDGKVKDRVDTRETSDVENEFTVSVQTEHATKDEIASISAAKQDEFERAIGGAVKQEDRNLGSGKDVDESLLGAKTTHANAELSESNQEKSQLLQSGKPSAESRERTVQIKTEFDKVLKDGVGQTVHHTRYGDADDDSDGSETAYEAEDWTKSDRDEDKLSSASLYDDHQTISDDDVDYDGGQTVDHRMTLSSDVPLSTVSDRDDGLRTVDHRRTTSSTEVPVSPLSDKEDEWATLSVTSAVSNRNLASPALLPRSSAGHPEVTQATAVQEVDSLKYVDHGAREEELVRVINKEHKAEIIVELGLDKADPDRMPGDEAVDPAFNNEEENAEIYWSGSDNEEEDELMQLEFRKEMDTDEVDSTIRTGDLSSMVTDPSYPVTSSVPRDYENLEHEAPEVDDAGKMDERLHGDMTSHEVTKDEMVAEDSSKLIADEQITKETVERVLSNPDLTNNTELVHGNDLADEDLVSAAISGHYLEREHGLPILTPLDRDEEPEESLRGEGPALYQDEETVRIYPLGEDGLPDFAGAEYSLGIAAEDAEEVEGHGQRLSEPDDSTQKPARMDDEVSVLPEAADSEVWDDELYNVSKPSSPAELHEPKTRGADTETKSGTAENQQGKCVEFFTFIFISPYR